MAFVTSIPVTSFFTTRTTPLSPKSPPLRIKTLNGSPAIFPPTHVEETEPNTSRTHSTRTVTVAVLDTPASNTYLQRHAELVLRDFLTRRAVNTVMYYMHELGDGPSHQWLSRFENFSENVKQRNFTNGDQFLENMFQSPMEQCSLRVGHPSGRFSRTYNFTIEPRKIAQRIVDVRVQLSKEWARDLRCVDAENLELQRLAFEKMVVSSKKELDAKRNLIFESDPFANDQTPLRFKNYVALKTLITQHAITRLLPYMRDRGSNHEYMYLLSFINLYGAIADGEDFLNTLMSKPAELRTNPTYTVVPRSIASQIMDLRSVIAAEWITAMDFVPVEYELNMRGKLEKSIEASMDIPDGTENGPN